MADWLRVAQLGRQPDRAVDRAVAHPASTDEVADVVRAAAADGLQVKPSAPGTRSPPPPPRPASGSSSTGCRHSSASTGRPLVTVRAGMQLTALNAALAAHGLAMPNLGDIDVQTISGALATGTHGTGAGYGCLSTFVEALELVTGDRRGAALLARRAPGRCSTPPGSTSARSACVTEVTLRCVRRVHRCTPTSGRRRWPTSGRASTTHDRRQRSLRVLLVPVHRPGPDQAQQPRRADVGPPAARAAAAGSTTSSCPTRCSAARAGSAGRCRRSVPTDQRASPPGRCPPAPTRPRPHVVFCTPRRVRFVEMEYGLPRAALREAFAGAAAGRSTALPYKVSVPGRGPVHRRRRHLAVARVRARQRYIAIHQYVGTPVRGVLPRLRGGSCAALGGRPHWGKMHFRDAASLATAYPRFDDFSRCATSSTRTACSPTPTPTASSAPDPRPPPHHTAGDQSRTGRPGGRCCPLITSARSSVGTEPQPPASSRARAATHDLVTSPLRCCAVIMPGVAAQRPARDFDRERPCQSAVAPDRGGARRLPDHCEVAAI